MEHRTTGPSDRLMRAASVLLLLAVSPFAFPSRCFGQQTYVTQFDTYASYAFLYSPAIGLWENGVQAQIGYRPRTWVTLGFDYSYSRGDLTITPGLLPVPLQQQLAAQLAALEAAGQIPPGYMLAVPTSSTTQTFAAGPQFSYRHFKKVTIFARPAIGLIHESAVLKPRDPIAAAIIAQLVPSGTKTDVTGFYGFGYGFDIILSKHWAWRTQGDLVWDHLFSDLLRNGRWTTRFSSGPSFNFGRNIAAK